MEIVHKPVLLRETLEFLSPVGEPFEKNAFMVDSTLGEGGHSEAFLSRFENLHIIGLDADPKIQARAKERLMPFGNRMSFHQAGSTIFMQIIQIHCRSPILYCSILEFQCSITNGRAEVFRSDTTSLLI